MLFGLQLQFRWFWALSFFSCERNWWGMKGRRTKLCQKLCYDDKKESKIVSNKKRLTHKHTKANIQPCIFWMQLNRFKYRIEDRFRFSHFYVIFCLLAALQFRVNASLAVVVKEWNALNDRSKKRAWSAINRKTLWVSQSNGSFLFYLLTNTHMRFKQ